ncbi:GNAT family N-acetyltransferase [Flagellimonas allohymeniacidonis]|uniref:GNAT family N-acetyltransferase n=1 Tax=Flagellimonas allohymeniacidonis TaxID=2517819 RepID=A0A4Q8QFR8_9FLAO|nr:GNAT family N-acetyltransferase [Allomuricauda hymeniacidonis]TAI46946.1 GNAT family N-acetyltransferase [Allomuricauda hymeniacidonis]
MEIINLNDNTYQFVKNFRDNADLRKSLNELTTVTFGFDFEQWYQDGYWGDHYVPYSLLHNDKIISNVSISKIEFNIENKAKLGIQIGTVMTDEAYRKRGLNKFILERVLGEWKDRCDFIYLFANDSVLDFYPKFNFKRLVEYQHSKIVKPSGASGIKQLNMANEKEKEQLIEAIRTSAPVSKVAARNNVPLVMFYCLSFKKNSIYYIESLKAIVVAEYEGDTLIVDDVFCRETVDVNEVIQYMSKKGTHKAALGFTPLDETDFSTSLVTGEDTLFVWKDHLGFFKNNQCRFPVLSHA